MKYLVDKLDDLFTYGMEKFGFYYSKYKGFVADVNDPKGYGRIKVNVPELMGDSILEYWAWPANNFSGKGYGSQCLPQQDDVVWVEFERGRAARPIWSFGHFGKDEKPEELKNIKNYWFKTPKGHLVELDDNTGEIRITNAQGKTVVMGKDKVYLIKSSDSDPKAAAYAEVVIDKLTTLIDQLLQPANIAVSGTSAQFNPAVVTSLNQLKAGLDQIKSTTVFID